MTQGIGAYPPAYEGDATQQSAAGAAMEQAAQVGESARDAGTSVAGTAAEQARSVADETRRQAAGLLDEAGSQVREQVVAGQRRAAKNLHMLAGQLDDMTDGSADYGLAARIAEDVSGRVRSAASWLDRSEPGELLDDVRDFARRRPGTFLLGAALAGVLAGRLTRGVAAAGHGGEPDVSRHRGDMPAATPAAPIAEPATPWPDPVGGPVAPDVMPGTFAEPEPEYRSDFPGPGTAGGGRGTDTGYEYRPERP